MDAIRLELEGQPWTFDNDDWSVLGPKTLVQHRETRVIFEVYPDPAKGPDDLFGPCDFLAQAVHHCRGLPGEAELIALGREAICMVLWTVGMMKIEPMPSDPEEIPF